MHASCRLLVVPISSLSPLGTSPGYTFVTSGPCRAEHVSPSKGEELAWLPRHLRCLLRGRFILLAARHNMNDCSGRSGMTRTRAFRWELHWFHCNWFVRPSARVTPLVPSPRNCVRVGHVEGEGHRLVKNVLEVLQRGTRLHKERTRGRPSRQPLPGT